MTDPADLAQTVRERAKDRAEQILDEGYPFPRGHPWWATAAKALARDVDELVRRLDQAERAFRKADDERDRLWRENANLREALQRIIGKATEAWEDVDAWEDTDGHVGVGRYESAKAGGLSVASDIARAALASRVRPAPEPSIPVIPPGEAGDL